VAELLRRGYGVAALQLILGANFLRVARATWPLEARS
jgi:microsomal dipeptidase-like Zn-dependent dipeptidase